MLRRMMGTRTAASNNNKKKIATMSPTPPAPGLSFRYGELTGNPVTVRKVVFSLSEPLPFVQKSLVSVELTVVNTQVPGRDISAKLRLELPSSGGGAGGANAVKRFEVLRNNKWYPAAAVPKPKAAEVVYKEKEAKHDVTVASNVGGANAFEIDVFPLPYQVAVQCRLEVMLDGGDDCVQQLVEWVSRSAESSEVHRRPSSQSQQVGGGAVVGEALGKTHFVCKIPPAAEWAAKGNCASNGSGPSVELPRVALLWDTSASMAPNDQAS